MAMFGKYNINREVVINEYERCFNDMLFAFKAGEGFTYDSLLYVTDNTYDHRKELSEGYGDKAIVLSGTMYEYRGKQYINLYLS